MRLVLLAEESATFIKMVSRGKGLWCRLPLNSNIASTEIDCAMPKVVKLFDLPDSVVRVTFKTIGLCKMHRNSSSHHATSNGVEEFQAKDGFDNDHL